ncbi:MAG: glycosyltransferase [Endomicrobiales bacterium]
MTKILYLITDLNIGGTEKVVFETACSIDRNRYQPFVVGLKKWGEYAQRLRERDVPTQSLDLYGSALLFPFKLISSLWRLVAFIRKEKIGLIHSFLFQANLLGKLLGLLCRVPVITSIRVMEVRKRWHLTLERLTRGLSKAVVVNSRALADFVERETSVPASRIAVIYNGIDTGACPAPDRRLLAPEGSGTSDGIIAVTAARLHEQKGVRYLLEAARRLDGKAGEAAPGIHFFVIGDGPERAFLEGTARSLGVAGKMTFCGWRKDVLALISSADIFVLPALWEGTPNAVLEAMACGRAVVATRVGGVPELIEDGDSGILVPPRDPGALADALLLLAQNPVLRKKLGENGRRRAQKLFSLAAMVENFEELYRRILRGRDTQ